VDGLLHLALVQVKVIEDALVLRPQILRKLFLLRCVVVIVVEVSKSLQEVKVRLPGFRVSISLYACPN